MSANSTHMQPQSSNDASVVTLLSLTESHAVGARGAVEVDDHVDANGEDEDEDKDDDDDEEDDSSSDEEDDGDNSDTDGGESDGESDGGSDGESDVASDARTAAARAVVARPAAVGGGPSPLDDGELDEPESEQHSWTDRLAELRTACGPRTITGAHPEAVVPCSAEVQAAARVVRDASGRIIDPLHKTTGAITRYERAKVLGLRAQQIAAGAAPLIETDVIDPARVALAEYGAGALPYIIRRPLPDGTSEYWRLRDLQDITY